MNSRSVENAIRIVCTDFVVGTQTKINGCAYSFDDRLFKVI